MWLQGTSTLTTQLGEASERHRGSRLLNVASQAGLDALNSCCPTFFRGRTSSVLDLTMVSISLLPVASWWSDIETFGSDHVPTYTMIEVICGGYSRRPVSIVSWVTFQNVLENNADTLSTSVELADAIARAQSQSTRQSLLTKAWSPLDGEYERLRAIRRRAERRARKTLSLDDIRAARRAQKAIQKHMAKLARKRWSQFCSKLDPRKPLTRIWQVVRSLRMTPSQVHPFSLIALKRGVSDVDVAEEFCIKVTAPQTSAVIPDVLTD